MKVEIDKLIRTNRHTIGIEINQVGELIVRAPLKCSNKEINSFIAQKWRWILKHQRTMKERVKNINHLNFVDGETLYYLGEKHQLKIAKKAIKPLDFENGIFYLNDGYVEYGREVFIYWFKREAKTYITKRVDEFSRIYGFEYHEVKITRALKRWGSCTRSGNLNFTWRLIMTPPEVIDYIIIHELAHLKQMNHSKNYWQIVEAIMPSFQLQEKWLTENGHKMII